MDNKKIRITTISVEKINVKFERRMPSSNLQGGGSHNSDPEDRERSKQDEAMNEKPLSTETSDIENTDLRTSSR